MVVVCLQASVVAHLEQEGAPCHQQHHAWYSRGECRMEARWERGADSPEPTTPRDFDDVSQASTLQPPSVYAYKRDVPPRTVMTALSVSASSLRLLRLIMVPPRTPQPSASGSAPAAGPGDARALHELQGQRDDGEAAESVASGDAAWRPGVQGWEDMGTIKRVSVFQAPVPPSSSDDRRRPIMVLADSIRLIITETTRCDAWVARLLLPRDCSKLCQSVVSCLLQLLDALA